MRVSCSSSLAEIAHLIDEASSPGCRDMFVHVVFDGDDVVLGLRYLHAHPCEQLADLVAPPEWAAVGVWVHGQARFLDEPSGASEPIVSTYLLGRSGASVSLLRRGGVVTELPGPAQGRIPDLCHKILGGASF